MEAMEAAGIHPIGLYIKRQKTTIEESVACRPVYELCMEGYRILGMIRLVQWLDQDSVNESEEYTMMRCN